MAANQPYRLRRNITQINLRQQEAEAAVANRSEPPPRRFQVRTRPRSRSVPSTPTTPPHILRLAHRALRGNPVTAEDLDLEDPEVEPMAGINNNNNFPPLDTSFTNRSPSPAGASQINGNGMSNGVNYMQPLPVGHQQDLNFLYAQIQELSSILQSNREKVTDITRTAEEVARRANHNQNNGVHGESGDHDSDKARIRELEHEVAKANKIIDLYKHEQRENTALIAQYEDALGTATEQIRNYCNDIDSRFLGQRRHYNNLLQAEKDEHLESRLDRDHWHAETLRLCEMIRTAYRLRCDEWGDEYRIIRGLQEEVRCLRNCIGMDPEKPEEETGWPYLKEDPYALQFPPQQSQSQNQPQSQQQQQQQRQ